MADNLMKAFKIVILALIALVIVIGIMGFKTFRDAGEFRKIRPHFKGRVTVLEGVQSSEDITIHPLTGMAFISSDERRPWFRGAEGRQGAIFGYPLTSDFPRIVNLTEDYHKPFHPHGIGLYLSPEGTSSLFVVNHTREGHFVEIFDFNGKRLVYRESVRGALMSSPNDVLPVGPRKFYVTNDHGNQSKLGRTLEEYLQLGRSYVLYYDGTRFRKVAEGLKFANGINRSPEGNLVYVASTVGHRISVYQRNAQTGALSLTRTVELDTGPDNIEVDEKGRLWIGAHPKLLTFVKYSKDPERLSPSQVVRVTLQGPGEDRVEEVYLNNGSPLSGSSVAAYFDRTLLIGSVFDPRFLICRTKE